MRHSPFHFKFLLISLVSFGGTTIGYSNSAVATPIYLRPESRFPSGHHPRKWLEEHTHASQPQRLQAWVRVETKDKATGWIPEDDLLTVAKFLDSDDDDGLKRAFVPESAPIHVLPGMHARIQDKARAGSFLKIVEHKGEKKSDWLEIHTNAGSVGYVRRSGVILASDLGRTETRTLTDLTPLRAAPLPYADLTRSLPANAVLKTLERQVLRWGQARVSGIGEIWWPMVPGGLDEDRKWDGLIEKISTVDLFKRKIFDMASSPAIPTLKFASASGVYRTNDGEEWTKIPLFQGKNYPIAVASSGAVFVGPYVSDDHGETFQQWIRWDSLVATLRKLSTFSPQKLQIQEIKPEDPTGRKVVLKLNLGKDSSVRLVTDDQGLSWRSF